jgi:hypothetical protein
VRIRPRFVTVFVLFLGIGFIPHSIGRAQEAPVVLEGAALQRVLPPGFYFEGQSAPTQMRNGAAARFGANRYVIAGMVDTSGYSTDVQAKYQGFLITDSPISVGGSDLAVGAYGFGFSKTGKFAILDLSGKELFSVAAPGDDALRRPRPLTMVKAGEGVRLYGGRNYVVIVAK